MVVYQAFVSRWPVRPEMWCYLSVPGVYVGCRWFVWSWECGDISSTWYKASTL